MTTFEESQKAEKALRDAIRAAIDARELYNIYPRGVSSDYAGREAVDWIADLCRVVLDSERLDAQVAS